MTPEERIATWREEQAAATAKKAASKERNEDSPGWADPRTPANAATATKILVDAALSKIVTAQSILDTHYPEPQWAVKGLIPQGTTFIAGPPKLGKSIWALNIAVAVGEGGKALSYFEVERGAVLYLALEDGPRRIQERLLKLRKGQLSDKLQVVTEWPRLNQGGLEAIEAWIERNKDARLLIVDTLKMLRPLATGRDRNAYDADYEAIQPLTKVASQRVALLIVHHTRKAIADDPLATVSGSYGLTGAADGVLVLSRRRGRSDATLNVIGRDVEEQELALEFKPDMYLWSVLGKAEEVKRSGEREAILDLFKTSTETFSPGEMALLLDRQPRPLSALLWKMKNDGQIKIFGKKYQLPTYKPPVPESAKKESKTEKAAKKPKEANPADINASTATDPDVDAQKDNGGNGLDAEHQRINDTAQSGGPTERGDGGVKVAQTVDALMPQSAANRKQVSL